MRDSTVAVLFGAYFKVSFEPANLRAKLIDPLKANTFVFLTYRADSERNDRCNSIGSCGVRARFQCLKPITRFEMERQLTTRELTEQLESSPGWWTLFKMYQQVSGCVRHNSSSTCPSCFADDGSSPYRCSSRLSEGGNTFVAPVIGNSKLNVLREFHMQARGLQMIAAHENGPERGGKAYEYVVWSRLEYVWLRPHPSPEHLGIGRASINGGAGCLWVPLGEDYGGLNDRHALIPRALAPLYLGRWNVIRDGKLVQIIPCLHPDAGSTKPCAQSSERMLAALLAYSNVSMCRFPPVAYLQCCGARHGESSHNSTNAIFCRKTACHSGEWPKSGNGTFQKGVSTAGTRTSHLSGKYPQELAMALVHASVLEVQGVRLGFRNTTWPPQGFWHSMIPLSHSLVIHVPSAGQGDTTSLGQWSKSVSGALRLTHQFTWSLIRKASDYRDTAWPPAIVDSSTRLLQQLLAPIGDAAEGPLGPFCGVHRNHSGET